MGSPYYYTQGRFWGGATASAMIYMFLAIFPLTGLFGLDHLYLHSPGTFIMKAILNIFTLGFWYFYDAIQAVSFESESVAEKGLSVPWIGPAGIGAGSFKVGGAAESPQNSLVYVAYVLSAMFVPFGLDYVIAGDYIGAALKYASLFMFGIGLIFGVINVYKIVMKPAEVFCEGTYRYAPFSWIFDAVNPNVAFTTKVGCPERPVGAGSGLTVIEFAKSVVRGLDRVPIIGPKIAAPLSAVVATAEAGIETVRAGVETAKAAVETAKAAVEQVPVAVETVSRVAASVNPEVLVREATKQIGGGGGGGAASNEKNPVALATLGLMTIGLIYITMHNTFRRLREKFTDMPPLVPALAPVPQNIVDKSKDELPPGASEPGVL
jgi:TM2 domain-containing membrane protein YozV